MDVSHRFPLSTSLLIPGEKYTMSVECFDPEQNMKKSPVNGVLQFIVVGELEVISFFFLLCFLFFSHFDLDGPMSRNCG